MIKRDTQNNFSRLTIYLIGQRRRFVRKLQRTYDDSQRTLLKSVIKRISQLIDENVIKDVNNWHSTLNKQPAGSKNFWRISKADGVNIVSTDRKVNVIADEFERAHQITENEYTLADRKVMKHVQWLES